MTRMTGRAQNNAFVYSHLALNTATNQNAQQRNVRAYINLCHFHRTNQQNQHKRHKRRTFAWHQCSVECAKRSAKRCTLYHHGCGAKSSPQATDDSPCASNIWPHSWGSARVHSSQWMQQVKNILFISHTYQMPCMDVAEVWLCNIYVCAMYRMKSNATIRACVASCSLRYVNWFIFI